jgi:hypothetical protein
MTPRCDCGRPARTVHLLPSLRAADSCRLACTAHGAGGFAFPVRSWRSPVASWTHPAFPRSVRDYVLTAANGVEVVELVEQTLAARPPQLWADRPAQAVS